MKTEWNARKTFYNFHILLHFTFVGAAACGKLDLSAASNISQLLRCGASAGTGLSVAESIGRLVEQLASRGAEKREQLQLPLPFRHWSLGWFSCFRWGIKANTANKIYSYPPHVDTRRQLFSDCDIVNKQLILRLLLKPTVKLDEGCCSARSLIARSLRAWTWWIDTFWCSLKGKTIK